MKSIAKASCLALLAISVLFPGVSVAKGTPDVARGIHNLSADGIDPLFGAPSPYRTNTTEVCVFCHTPHGGSLTGPLWNRSDPTSTWTHYSNATLSTYMQTLATGRTPGDESLICLSCHDGSISVNHLLNNPNTLLAPQILTSGGNPNTVIDTIFGQVGAKIGASPSNLAGFGDLTDDHPISFSYTAVLGSSPYQAGESRFGELRSVAAATTYAGEGVRFFGATNRVECSSCHDPHVYYNYLSAPDYGPFLIMPNSGSNLCLACHNK